MKSLSHRALLCTAAAVVMLSGVAAHAQAGPLTRAEVRAELAEARAAGLLDVPGEAGATEQVLQAREMHNHLQALVIAARQRLLADEQPEVAVYVERGPLGPVLVLVTFDGGGEPYNADT
jgi:hypothetical protein